MDMSHAGKMPERVFKPIGIVPKEMLRLRCYVLLAISDVFAITVAFISANVLVNLRAPTPVEHGFVMLGVILPLFAIQAGTNGAYGAEALEKVNVGIRRVARALMVAAAIILLVAYMLKASGEFSRGVFAFGFGASFVLTIAARRLLHPHLTRILSGSPHTTIVICDGGNHVRQADEIILSTRDLGFDPLTTDPRAYHLFSQTIAHADRMIVACEPGRAAAWGSVLRSLSIDGEILTDVRDEVGAIGMRDFAGRRTFVVNYGPMTLSARVTKRLFDIGFSLFALILFAPLLLTTAIAIRAESSGPVFFRQERIGRGNRIFRIFKFRSMYAHQTDQHGERLTQVGDSRVTRVGAFIRRTSIDELPQLLNVLQGDMSIVGPRPHALAAKAADLLYWDADERYRQRHVIKPGMTGLAQVRGFRGNTNQIEDLTNRLQADLEYVATWSLKHDLAIIGQTLKVMLHSNAY